MNAQEFLTAFAEIVSQFDWYLSATGQAIRGRASVAVAPGVEFCPLTAYHYATTGRIVSTGRADAIAGGYALEPEARNAIMDSADDVEEAPLRQPLLALCGLTEGRP